MDLKTLIITFILIIGISFITYLIVQYMKKRDDDKVESQEKDFVKQTKKYLDKPKSRK